MYFNKWRMGKFKKMFLEMKESVQMDAFSINGM